jgi:hypothetical protein
MIGVTEPRRVAATTLAARVAEEQSCALGEKQNCLLCEESQHWFTVSTQIFVGMGDVRECRKLK